MSVAHGNADPAMPFLLLMPSYNQARYIGAAISSVLAQDDPDWELWIVDNSSDDTPAVVARFADPRIRFHHIPERMDPGSCLNWMLARAQGRDFSYIHTDNNLYPGYVRAMRAALASDPLSLAYCDLRLIDDDGRRVGVHRRGAFDLPQLLSTAPLGVPFSATTALSSAVGGFRSDCVADDVMFCTRAHGLGRWTHLREPLIDYRLHGQSRTNADGGYAKVQMAYLAAVKSAIPDLVARGLQPMDAMRDYLGEFVADLGLAAEDVVLRLEPYGVRWWGGDDYLDGLWRAGLLDLPGMRWFWQGAPSSLRTLATLRAGLRNPFVLWAARFLIRRRMDRELLTRADAFRHCLVAYAYLVAGDGPVVAHAGSSDALTLWACRTLARRLGWRVALAVDPPTAFGWERASGRPDAWIDLSGRGVCPPGVASIVT